MLIERRSVGQNVTKAEYDDYLGKIALFTKWFNKKIASTASESNDHSVVILPIKSQNSRYGHLSKT